MSQCLISLAEVKKHKKKPWIIINNNVYDVSNFLNEHPGGAQPLLDFAGKDATQAFEDVGHSADARKMMEKYQVGELPAQERKIHVGPCKSSHSNKSWRTYDGSPSKSRSKISLPKESKMFPSKAERAIHTVVVPKESNAWKWALLALAVALTAGIAYKKYGG